MATSASFVDIRIITEPREQGDPMFGRRVAVWMWALWGTRAEVLCEGLADADDALRALREAMRWDGATLRARLRLEFEELPGTQLRDVITVAPIGLKRALIQASANKVALEAPSRQQTALQGTAARLVREVCETEITQQRARTVRAQPAMRSR